MLDSLFEQAITAGEIEKFQEMTDSLEFIIIKAHHFPDKAFQFLVSLFTKKYFLVMEKSRHILYIFRTDFELLSKAQKDQLILSLGQAYGNLQDWMSWFIISEILGECYQNEQALQTLCNLK